MIIIDCAKFSYKSCEVYKYFFKFSFQIIRKMFIVISASTLIKDAEARNKVFLDIIRKQTKLNRLIQKTEVVE